MQTSRRIHRYTALGLALLSAAGLGCESRVDVSVTSTPRADGSTPEPFPFAGVEAAFVGISGSNPYVILYEDPYTCEELSDPSLIAGQSFSNILILVGGWEEGTYPIIDILSTSGGYDLDGHAIAYLAERRVPTLEEQAQGYGSILLESVSYATGGALVVDQISELTTTAKGSFALSFEGGDLLGDYVIREYCDLY